MAMSQNTKLPHRVKEWTKEQVYYWLTEVINVDKKHADKLLEEDVSGEELVCYQSKHLQELGIKYGPAVKIITQLEKLNMEEYGSNSNDNSNIRHTEANLDTVENKGSNSTDQTKISGHKNEEKSSKTEKSKFGMNDNMNRTPKLENVSMADIYQVTTPTEDLQPNDQPNCPSVKETEPRDSVDYKTLDISADKVTETEKTMRKSGSLKPSFTLHPFDQNSASHRYIQNYTVAPEARSGNLIDPVHEFKFMGRTDDMNVMKKKFNREVFRFTAGCMNSRTNGTIHFGVADSKDSQYAHAEIIGVSLDKKDTIIDHFNQGIKSYFEEHTDEAKACIRQPRFVEVLCPDGTLSGKYVIEVDVVPSHSIVKGKLFYTKTPDEDNQWKKRKRISLFIRDGTATRDIYKIGNPKDLHDELTRINGQMNVLDDRRKEAEKRQERKENH